MRGYAPTFPCCGAIVRRTDFPRWRPAALPAGWPAVRSSAASSAAQLGRESGLAPAGVAVQSQNPLAACRQDAAHRTLAATRIHWSADDWNSVQDTSSHDTGLGVHLTHLPTQALAAGGRITTPDQDSRVGLQPRPRLDRNRLTGEHGLVEQNLPSREPHIRSHHAHCPSRRTIAFSARRDLSAARVARARLS